MRFHVSLNIQQNLVDTFAKAARLLHSYYMGLGWHAPQHELHQSHWCLQPSLAYLTECNGRDERTWSQGPYSPLYEHIVRCELYCDERRRRLGPILSQEVYAVSLTAVEEYQDHFGPSKIRAFDQRLHRVEDQGVHGGCWGARRRFCA